MGRRLALRAALLLVLVLVLGVGNAGGAARASATPVLIEVIGLGKVTGPGVICGRGETTCYVTYSSSGSVALTAGDPGSGWSFNDWGGTGDTDCTGNVAPTCTIPLDDNPHQITANFATSVGTSSATLGVGVPNNTGGKVTGGPVDCGSGPSNACTLEVLTGSTLTVLETPDAGYFFTGWAGACTAYTNKSCTVWMTNPTSIAATFQQASASHTLTVTVAGNGHVVGGGISCNGGSTCSAVQPGGAFVDLTATPAAGYIFTGWSGGCTGTLTTCTVQMTGDKTVTAAFEFTYQLTVSVVGNGAVTGGTGIGVINCGSGGTICSAPELADKAVVLTATSVGTATFTGWSGACSGVTITCTVTMNAAKSVTATFTGGTSPTTFVLSVIVSGKGTVTGSGINCGSTTSACSASLAGGTTVTLTATPASGATFSGWGGPCSSTTTTCTFTITAATSVTATFAGGASTFRLSVSVTGAGKVTGPLIDCGSGKTTCSANETANASVTLTATPAAGMKFKNWGGACAGPLTTCQVVMNADRNVTATFEAKATRPTTAKLTLKVTGKGAVTTPAGKCASRGKPTTCTQLFAFGKRVTLKAAPAKGQTFRGWSGSCKGKKTSCTVSLTAARSVTATFSNRTVARVQKRR